MKKLLPIIVSILVFASCNSKEGKADMDDNKISLHSDTTNVVKLKDTLVIYESTCRGCAYETSTDFEVRDSLGIVKLYDIHTINSSPSDMSGGSVGKNLILVPQKTGTTTFKLFKYWGEKTRAKDSLDFTPYTITVTN